MDMDLVERLWNIFNIGTREQMFICIHKCLHSKIRNYMAIMLLVSTVVYMFEDDIPISINHSLLWLQHIVHLLIILYLSEWSKYSFLWF